MNHYVISGHFVPISITAIPRYAAPIYGAKEIEKILSKRIQYDGSIFRFLKGTIPNDTEGLSYADDNLDINVLDMRTLKKIINIAKKEHNKNFRRSQKFPEKYYETAGFKTHVRDPMYFKRFNRYYAIVDRLYFLMLQSIYATRERIRDIFKLKDRYKDSPSYKIGLLVQTTSHNFNKMETLYANLRYLPLRTYFIWYITIYQKILQCNIDIEYAVIRIFKFDKQVSAESDMPDMSAISAAGADKNSPALTELLSQYIASATTEPPTVQQKMSKYFKETKTANPTMTIRVKVKKTKAP